MKIEIKKLFAGITLIIALGLFAGYLLRQDSAREVIKTSVFDQLYEHNLPTLTITTDLENLIANKEDEKYQPATVTWTNQMNQQETYDIKVSSRGKTRKEICSFPPLKLNFDKDELEARGLATHDKLKLVSHCIDNENLVLKEYLAYKLYSQLTGKSFRAQLIRVQYMDSENRQESMERYAVIIEPMEEMAGRLGGVILESKGEELRRIDAQQYNLLTVFQYMIGNTDWNLSRRHNVKLVQLNGQHSPLPVPYDFDFSGIVNAPYAKPHPQLPISNVTQRFFQWRGKSTEGLDMAIELFKSQKDSLYSICRQFDQLPSGDRQQVLEYLNSFYQMINQIDSGEEFIAAVTKKSEEVVS